MTTALLKFSQGATVGGNGEALKGDLSADFTIANSDNTGVGSWEIQILEIPYGSATAKGTLAQGNTSTPIASLTPDVIGGCYRVQLRVWPQANRQGTPNTDIRCIGLDGANGMCPPPPMVWPLPLPHPNTGLPNAKPNEMNFAGGLDSGWAGNGNDGLLRHALRILGAGGSVAQISRTRFVDGGTAVGTGAQDGTIAKPFATITQAIAALLAQALTEGAGDYGYTIVPFPGNYAAETPAAWAPDNGASLTIAAAITSHVPIIGGTPVYLPVLTGNTGLELVGVNCGGNTGFTDLKATSSDLSGTVTVTGGNVFFKHCGLYHPTLTCGAVQADGCDVACSAETWTVSGTQVEITNTKLQLNVLVFSGSAGTLKVDTQTAYWIESFGITLTNGSQVLEVPGPVDLGAISNWYVNDSTGSDTNDGLSSGTAFKTTERLSEVLCPRGAVLSIQQDTTVHLAAGGYGRLRLDIDCPTATNYFLTIVGATSLAASITTASVTNTNPATPTRGRITTASGTFHNATRVRAVTGTHAGAVAYTTALTSATDAFVSSWVDDTVSVVNLTVGDHVQEETLLVSVAHVDLKQGSFGGIIVQDCNLVTGADVDGASQHDAIQIYRCEVGGTWTGVCAFISCAFVGSTVLSNGNYRMFGNVNRTLIQTEAALLRLSQRNTFDAGRLIVADRSQVVFYADPSGETEFENGSGGLTAIDVRAGCSIISEASSRLWGVTGTYGTAIRIRSGASASYVTLPTIPSTINVNLAGVTVAWAALPMNDTTHMAGMVEVA